MQGKIYLPHTMIRGGSEIHIFNCVHLRNLLIIYYLDGTPLQLNSFSWQYST